MRSLFRAAGLMLVAMLGVLTWQGLPESTLDDVKPEQTIAMPSRRPLPLPPTDPQAGISLLARSAFAPDRSAFDRQTASAAPPPPLEVRLTGIFKVGKEMSATLQIGGQAVTVRKGSETSAGVVSAIESSAVVIDGAPPRRIEMFKQ